MKAHYFTRRFMIHICKDGTISYRDTSIKEKVFNNVALPVYSVDTKEQAKDLQVTFGRLQYGEHPLMPGQPWYRFSMPLDKWTLELDDLDMISRLFEQHLAPKRLPVEELFPDGQELSDTGLIRALNR